MSFGDGMLDPTTKRRVHETLDDIRDIRGHSSCHHNEIPHTFPVSDEGFER